MGLRKRSNKQNPPPSTSRPSDANDINIGSSRGPHHHFNASLGSGPIPSRQVHHTEPTTSQLLHSQPITVDSHLTELPDHITVGNNSLVSETTRGVPCVADAAETQDVCKDVVDPFNLYPSAANSATYIPHLAGPVAFPAFPLEERNTSARATPAFPSPDALRHETLPQYISPQLLHSTSGSYSGPTTLIDNASLMHADTSSKAPGEHDTSSVFDQEMEEEAATSLLTPPPSYSSKAKRKRTHSDKHNEIIYAGKLKAGFDALEFILTAGSCSLKKAACLQAAAQCITQLRADNVKLTEDNGKLIEENIKLREERQLFKSKYHAVPES